MSLRQLKFKPKLQLKPPVKNETRENNRSSLKELCSSEDTPDSTKNSSSSTTPLASLNNGTDSGSILVKTNESKEDSQNVTSVKNVEQTLLTESVNTLKNCKDDTSKVNLEVKSCEVSDLSKIACLSIDSNTSKDENTSTSIISDTLGSGNLVSQTNGYEPCISLQNYNGISELKTNNSQSGTSTPDVGLDLLSELEDDSVNQENNRSSIVTNKKQNSLINYDVLQKINFDGNKQDNSTNNNNEQKPLDKENVYNLIPTNEKKEISNELSKTKTSEIISDKNLKQVYRNLHKPNFVSKNDKIISENTTSKSSEPKNFKRKKHDAKNLHVNPNKANFKPNVATLGKIRRPEKFTTSSYSKMGFKAKEQFFKKFGKKEEPDSSKLTMMDLIFYNPSSNPMSQSNDKKDFPTVNGTEKTEKEDLHLKTGEDKTDKDDSDVLPVPQLKISADGKVIVAQESLVIQPSQNFSNSDYETVIDGEFRKKKPVKNPNRCGWSHSDTINFYKALNSLGCDFETMQSIFPDRSRKNLKSKFKKEEKLHGSLINKVLSRHSEFDITNVIRELEIDTVYQKTIKTYGRGLAEIDKRPKGRKKPFSSIVAGRTPDKDDELDYDSTDEELSKKKKKVDLGVISKISTVLGLSDLNNEANPEVKNNSSKSDINDTAANLKEEVAKRKRRLKENVESCTENDSEWQYPASKYGTDKQNSDNSQISPKILRKRNKLSNEDLSRNNIIIRLEDLIDFNEGTVKESQSKSKTEIINDNHIVINTNIEFENVKYTRYISYNSNNLENPIEINETVAHVESHSNCT